MRHLRDRLTRLSACSIRDAAPARRSYRAQADHPAGPGAAEWYRRKEPEVGRTALTWIWPRAERYFPRTYSSRTRFMIETLTNLRNNKMKPATGVAADAEANLKRFITNLAKKSSGTCRPNHAGLQT